MFLSNCSRDYLHVLTNPFGSTGQVCIPDIMDLPSSKYRVVARGTLVCGTQGFGFIQLRIQGSAANNVTAISYSNSSTNFITSVTSEGVAAGTTTNIFSSAPYTAAQIASTASVPIKSRIVALGVRVRYIGTELARGGRMVLVRKPFGATTDGLSTATVLSDRSTISLPVNRQWVGVNYLPSDSDDYEYMFSANYPTNPRLAILIDSSEGNLFEYEAVQYVEYTGTVVNLSPSHSDITGMSTIREAVTESNTIEPAGQGYFDSVYQRITNFGSEVLSHPETVKLMGSYAQKALL